MKTLGLVGGTGWISTVEYYRIINEEMNKALGGLNFAKCLLYSFNYGEINALNQQNDTEGVYALVLDASKKLISIGAEGIVLCANTLHQFADSLETESSVPIIHIATATAKQIKKQNLSTIGLLGTKYTMELDFYTSKLQQAGIEAIVPNEYDRAFIHDTIMNELLKGIFRDERKSYLLEIIRKLQTQGAEGIVLGCTELPLILQENDIDVPVFNTLIIHARAAVDFALGR